LIVLFVSLSFNLKSKKRKTSTYQISTPCLAKCIFGI
jgi:hypothetical protein